MERALELDGQAPADGLRGGGRGGAGGPGDGLGTLVMAEATDHIRDRYELGVPGTGEQHFYERARAGSAGPAGASCAGRDGASGNR